MDSRTILDNALFQLTPTRTRCDLVIFGGGLSEKLASGLLEPFISHLKTAKDQISRGGYSITLRPSPPYSSWFTKATLQRFVRFVSTPEVLERFVTIEREIEQIESSVPSNEQSKGDYNGANDTAQEENSKVRLQRALETRRSVLRKEQAMAYARTLVTGFDLDCINDLISFADAFGASRLREACINFMELCKKKNQDRLWMDEIAAMQASRLELPFLGTSGITLAGEEYPSQIGGLSGDSAASLGSVDLSQDNSLPASDGKAQVPAPWPNHLPQYMHNFQGPVFQQMPPYQGYVFPGMQVGSPYFPGNMQWSSNPDGGEHDDHRKHKSSSRNKKKSSRGKGREDSKQENSTEPSDTSSETESDENLQNGITRSSGEHARRKKHGKKSSRKVVIRNINYITSKRDGENGRSSKETSDEDDFIDGEALKHQVEEAVGSLDRRHNSNSRHRKKSHRSTIDSSNDATNQENKNVAANNLDGEKAKDQWGAFQSLLLNDKDTESFGLEPHTLPVQEEYFTMKSSQEGRSLDFSQETEGVRKQRAVSNDSFIATKGEPSNEGESRTENFENVENLRKMVNKRDNTYEDLLFSHQSGESGKYPRPTVSDYSSESPMIRSQKEGDWFVNSQLCRSENKDESMDSKMFDGDYASTVNGNKKDNLADDSFMIQTRAFMDDQPDLRLRTDISMVAEVIEATQYENGTTAASNDKVDAFNEHEPDDLYMVLGRNSAAERDMPSWAPELDYENEMLSADVNGRMSAVETNDSDDKLASDSKNSNGKTSGNPSTKNSGKEARSRISNGSLAKSKSDIMSRTKKPLSGGRTTFMKSKAEKEEENRKRMEELMIQRQKRIAGRSSAGNGSVSSKRIPSGKVSTSSAKNEKPKVQSPSEETKKPVFRSSTIDRLATTRTTPKMPSTAPSRTAQSPKPNLKANGISHKNAGADNKKSSSNSSTVKSDNHQKKDGTVAKTKKPADLAVAPSGQPTDIIDGFKDIKELRSVASVEKNEESIISGNETLDDKGCNGDSLQTDTSAQLDYLKPDDAGLAAASPVPREDSRIPDDHSEDVFEIAINPMPESPSKTPNIYVGDIRENSPIPMNQTLHPFMNSEIEISTPAPAELEPEPVHSRKKWNSDDSSPKAAKGFRKLLLFGKKSRTTAVN